MVNLTHLTILYIEDEPGLARLVQLALKRFYYSVDIASDGEIGVSMCLKKRYDIVIVDYKLPNKDGLSVVEELAELNSLPPIIMLSSSESLDVAIRAMKLGVLDYIVKDANTTFLDLLPISIKKIIEKQQLLEEKIQAEKELAQYRVHLEELVAERTRGLEANVSELESYSYSLAHDLRTPVRTITSFSQLILSEAENRLIPQDIDYLKRIMNAGKNMDKIIEGLLKLSRFLRCSLQIKSIDFSFLAENIMDQIQQENPKFRCHIDIQPNIQVIGDSSMLSELLYHLLDNAMKFSSKQENIQIRFGMIKERNEKVYYVKDNGIGFDMQYSNKLFKAFERLHNENEYAGKGIGLATAFRIVDRHNGRIWVDSKINVGTSIYFTLSCKLENAINKKLENYVT